MLGRFFGHIDFKKDRLDVSTGTGDGIKPLGDLQAVHCMHQRKLTHGCFHLVRLQRADQVPFGSWFSPIAERLHFRQRFLHAILPEMPAARLPGRAQSFDRDIFRGGDHGDLGWMSPDTPCGAFDPGQHHLQAIRELPKLGSPLHSSSSWSQARHEVHCTPGTAFGKALIRTLS